MEQRCGEHQMVPLPIRGSRTTSAMLVRISLYRNGNNNNNNLGHTSTTSSRESLPRESENRQCRRAAANRKRRGWLTLPLIKLFITDSSIILFPLSFPDVGVLKRGRLMT